MKFSLRCARIVRIALVTGLCVALSPLVSQGQLAETASATVEDREQLYEELAAEVDALEAQLGLLKKVIRLVRPSVVHIEASKRVPANTRSGRKPVEEAGSGIVIEVESNLYILTNRHVIDEAQLSDIAIKLSDRRVLHPTTVWADRETDVAVMAIDSMDLHPARLGDSDKTEIGDFVIAVGSPFGLSQSVTYGIISAMGRRDLKLGDGSIRYQDFMQTDAAINPGNSGGPLLNLRGEVVGLNTAIASSSGGSEGIGFTIPINMAITVAKQFIEHGHPVRAFLGVNLNGDDFSPEYAARLGLPRARGALVASVIGGSPAAIADFRPDDVVLEFDGRQIEDDDHLIKIVGFTPVDKDVEVVVFRSGELIRLEVKLAERRRTALRP
ncbi:MAG TPA: trypsin-like peptidase domain-containing protein [Pirellulaceae bacterium]|nr:trypsin-like peptidase domain-containing protein [Planctomycetales bacterium]HRX77860.1 trypsin-like peptidase domain-containing protein [Pirellulaceae bacterium]